MTIATPGWYIDSLTFDAISWMRFVLSFRCAGVDAATGGAPDSLMAAIQKRRLRVLVVDDRADFRVSFALRLTKVYHASVEQAANAQAGIDRLGQEPRVDVILMDVAMTGMAGDEACPAIRAQAPDTHIVLMSAYRDNKKKAEAQRVPFLHKPVKEPALTAILAGCLGDATS